MCSCVQLREVAVPVSFALWVTYVSDFLPLSSWTLILVSIRVIYLYMLFLITATYATFDCLQINNASLTRSVLLTHFCPTTNGLRDAEIKGLGLILLTLTSGVRFQLPSLRGQS